MVLPRAISSRGVVALIRLVALVNFVALVELLAIDWGETRQPAGSGSEFDQD